jgi:hypothetical protein
MIKEKDEEHNKVGKDWMDSEILHLITLWREMELEFAKDVKKQSKFEVPWNPSCVCFDTRFLFQIWNLLFLDLKCEWNEKFWKKKKKT